MNSRKIISKIIEYPLVPIFFALCIATFATYLIKPDSQFSEMENRTLMRRPQVSIAGLLDGTFMNDFETFCNEQIPFRNAFVKTKAVLEQAKFSSENDGIAKGRDGYLFDKTLSTNSRLSQNISAITNFAKEASAKEREVYIAIAPTSVWINEDKLPCGMPVLDEAHCSELFAKSINAANVSANIHCVSLYDELMAHRDEMLYYRTDHHWTTKAAGYAYAQIMDEMGIEPESIEIYTKHEVSDFYGTSYAKYKGIGITPDIITYYDVPIEELRLEKKSVSTLYDCDKFDTYDKYSAFMYGNDGMYEVITKAEQNAENHTEGADLIILKDSYANCLIPYLAMNFNDIIVVDLRYFGGTLSQIIDDNENARILLMYNWSFVNEDNHFYKLVK